MNGCRSAAETARPGWNASRSGGGVRERVAHHQEPVRLVAEHPAHADRGEQRQQRQVEQQVPGFPQVALFRRYPAVAGAQPEPLGRQHRRRGRERLVRGERGLVTCRERQPGQVGRRRRRLLPRRPGQPERARDHASRERGEQQQVDRGEPGRGEDVEQRQPGQQRRQRRVSGVILLHRLRVDPLLRQHRPGHAAQREQEQEHQRGPHGGQLEPGPPRPVPDAKRGRRGTRRPLRDSRPGAGRPPRGRGAHPGHRAATLPRPAAPGPARCGPARQWPGHDAPGHDGCASVLEISPCSPG